MAGLSSFYTAVSGMKGQLFSMNVIGNNIANVGTSGYKSGRASFQESLVSTIRDSTGPRGVNGGINGIQVGLGMEVSSVASNNTQGTLQTTGILTDLAIEGNGYFVTRQGQNQYYTRSGNFTFDANGFLTDRSSGSIVQGWLADNRGVIPSGTPTTNIRLPFGETVPGQATEEVKFAANLNADATDSLASLSAAGVTGIDYVNGTVDNGAGGTHSITVTGTNATSSTASGTVAALTGSETLGSLGVMNAGDFAISVDGGASVPVLGLALTSTVTDLINAVNNLNIGVTAALDGGGAVSITRDYAGDGTLHYVTTSAAVVDGSNDNITAAVFGQADTVSLVANSGVASSIAAIDTFTPYNKPSLGGVALTITMDPVTGLANGFSDVGKGGVTVTASGGLAAGTAEITTEDTDHATSLLVFDSLGREHTLNVTFTRSANTNQWYWNASFDGGEAITAGGSGLVEFNEDGSLRSWNANDSSLTLDLEPGTGAESMSLDLFTGTVGGYDGLTQFSSVATATAISQDGYGMGNLNSISIGADGKIQGVFSNGVLRDMGQVVLAKFANGDGLMRAGGNLLMESANSGQAIIGAAGTNVDARIASGALEMSNVDLAEEFVNMIVAQRGFQANARVITTGDEMTTELINLKR